MATHEPMLFSAHPIVRFFLGDSQLCYELGFSPDSLKKQDWEWWEGCHNHIQWAFPLREASAFNPNAPRVTDDVIEAFDDYPVLREQLRSIFMTFLMFLGETQHVWMRPGDHNLLRITRAIKCLRMFGLEDEAWHLYVSAYAMVRGSLTMPKPIGPEWKTTFKFWDEAIGR